MSLLKMSISAVVLILAVLVIRSLAINRLPKRTFLVLWGVVLCRLLIPFSVPSPFSIYTLMNRAGQSGTTVPNFSNIGAATVGGPFAGIQQAPLPETVPTVPWAAIIWAVGFAVCTLFFVVSYLLSQRKFQTAIPIKDTVVAEWLDAHPIRRHIKVSRSDRIKTPLCYGILYPVILLPKKMDFRDKAQLNYVLTHEYTHICRFDGATKLLLTAALCVHWFNPLVWAMVVLANRDIELSCDEAVVRAFGDTVKSAYARALIGMEERKSGLMPLCNSFSKNAIEERITAIMKTKKTTVLSLALALLLVAGTTTVFATSASGASSPDADIVQGGVTFDNVNDTLTKDGSDKNGDVTIAPSSNTEFSNITPHSENSVNATVTQTDTGSKDLGESGNSRMSVSAGREFSIGKATWSKGQQITLFVESERENELEIGIRYTSTGKVSSETVKTGTGTVMLPILQDGEYQIFVRNTSKSEADFSLGYMVNVP